MLWSWLSVYVGLAAFASASLFHIDASLWENTRYYRTFDLARPYVKEHSLIEVKNVSPEPQDVYVLTVNDGFDAIMNISHYAVLLVERQEKAYVVELSEGIYAVKFPFPLAPGSSIEMNAMFVYTDAISPLPQKVELEEEQKLLLKLNKFCYSPYVTNEYSLSFTGLTLGEEIKLNNVPAPTADLPQLEGRVEKESRVLTYGPIQAKIPGYSVSPMGLHYDHNLPLTHATVLERSFWLPASDVGVVQTEEYYELQNRAAELKSGFSRVDWLKGRHDTSKPHHCIQQLEFPVSDHTPFNGYYITDKVGMVTTHDLMQGYLVIQPRFPLFGGWNYNFTLGWNAPLETFVRKLVGEEDTYVASFPLLNSLKNVHYDKVYFNIYLPENAEYIDASALEAPEKVSLNSELSFLDVSEGHVKVTLEFSNMVDGLAETKVLVKYRYTPVSYWKKVAKIAGFVFVAFASYYVLGLVDLSIKK